MTLKMLNWFFLLLTLVAMFILGQVLNRAYGATYDPFVQRLEMLFGVHPGGYVPVDTRAPDIRLLYNRTTPIGNGCYAVNVCRIR